MDDDTIFNLGAQVIIAVCNWRDARLAFIALPPDAPDTRESLNRLASAENELTKLANRAWPRTNVS